MTGRFRSGKMSMRIRLTAKIAVSATAITATTIVTGRRSAARMSHIGGGLQATDERVSETARWRHPPPPARAARARRPPGPAGVQAGKIEDIREHDLKPRRPVGAFEAETVRSSVQCPVGIGAAAAREHARLQVQARTIGPPQNLLLRFGDIDGRLPDLYE